MNAANLRRRLDALETERHTGAPLRIVANYPITDDEACGACANWRTLAAKGQASARRGVLYLMKPPLTVEEWEAQHVTAH